MLVAMTSAACDDSADSGAPNTTGRPRPTTTTTTSPATTTSTVPFVAATETVTIEGDRSAFLDDLRVARHDGFDRVVLQFADQVPAPFPIRYLDEAPSEDCVFDKPTGAAVLHMRIPRATGFDTSADPPRKYYDGPQTVRGDTSVVTETVITCDFEMVLTVAIGVRQRAPFRVTQLENPPRLVIDVQG